MKFLFFIYFITSLLYGAEFAPSTLMGTWELSPVDDRGFLNFGKDHSRKRGETWVLEFTNRKVVNKTKGRVYSYYVENGVIYMYTKKVKQSKYYTRSIVKNISKIKLLKPMRGMDSGCYLVKKLTQYKSNRRYKLCKIEDTPIPVYDVDSFRSKLFSSNKSRYEQFIDEVKGI